MASKNAAIEPNGKSAALKERAIREFKLYWIVVLYLWLFLGSFTVYRRLVVAEAGAAYLNYGIAVIEALVIAKVVLIGRMFGFSRRFEDSPLIVPVIYKTILFSILVLLFGVAEKFVGGWVRKQGLAGGFHAVGEVGMFELGARVLLLIVALVPFFAFSEIGRVLGPSRLSTLFLGKREPAGEAQPPLP